MYIFSQENGAQYGLTIIERDLNFHAMVQHEKYILPMSQERKFRYDLENFETLTLVMVVCFAHFGWLNHIKTIFFVRF